jgi:2-hydroxy-3-oxopropionate reductase
MQAVGLIGLGNAGRPLGERILKKGYFLTVYDLNPEAVEVMAKQGARAAGSAREAVSEVTLTVLPSSVDVRAAMSGETGVLAGITPSMTVIDLSGTDPDCAREIGGKLAEKGASFLGGTLHAGGAPAVVIPKGLLSIVIGGRRETVESCTGLLQDLAHKIICLPEPWMPKALKIAIIMLATASNIITTEVCAWLSKQGLDPGLFLRLLQITGSQASASRLEEFLKRNNNHGGALSNSYKDIRQALKVAAELNIPLPLTSMAHQLQEMGRVQGLSRTNSPAAMGKLYEILTGADLSAAQSDTEKTLPDPATPQVYYLWDPEQS